MKRDLETLLSEIRKGKAPSLLLIHGDDFQIHAGTKAILDLLLPPEKRAFNLERFDGRSTAWEEIEAALMTPPFFPGKKTVLIENAPYFLSRESRGELSERVLQLWNEGKKDGAASLLADLLLLEGWTQERWEHSQDPTFLSELSELFSAEEQEIRGELEALLAFCRTRGMDLSQPGQSEADRLMGFLEQEPPPWDILLIVAPHVDRRGRPYKKFEEKGMVLDLSLERDKRGRIGREGLEAFLERRLKEAGKRIEAPAKEMILLRAGEELWGVQQELEKLLLYVGAEPLIRVEDVAEAFLDQGEAWLFDLSESIARKDPIKALGYLDRLIAQGDHALKLLGTIASGVRRLLLARQLLEGELGQWWNKGMSYPEFQRSLLRHGSALPPGNPYAHYMSLKNAQNFTTQELCRHLEWIYEADIRLKSAGHSPRTVLERLILEMCQPIGNAK